jgi:hypothetical protein
MRKQKFKCVDEWDWMSHNRYDMRKWRSGQGKQVKQRLNKRFRREIEICS